MREVLRWAALAAALLAAAGAAGGDDGPRRARGKSPQYREAIAAIEKIARAKPPSDSTGTLTNGGLRNAAELPPKGFGYRLVNPKRGTNFGTDELVYTLIEVAALLQELHPNTPWLSIGDISKKEGGKLDPHLNHQQGRDVDLAFLYCTPDGKPAERGWLKCDADGKTRQASAVFDAARNFELLVLITESPYCAELEWIFCADPLKKLLVDHGRALAKAHPKNAAAIEAATAKLEKLLRQPESSPHDDHFHIRVCAR
jgi:murein endopeptidase